MNRPQKVEDLGLPPEALAKHSSNSSDFPTFDTVGKAMLKAKLAQAGFVVHTAQGGGFDVIRADWGQCRHCKDEAELKSFAQKVGVNHE